MKGLLTIIIIVAVIIVLLLLLRGNDTIDNPDSTPTPNEEDITDSEDVDTEDNNEIMAEDDEEITNETDEIANDVKEFTLTGKNFEFSTKEIRVKKGDTVRINFSSTNGNHDWTIDEFNAKTNVVSTGNTTSVKFVANQSGTFQYYCSVGTHRAMGMIGNLIVE
jgi:plastocyanin